VFYISYVLSELRRRSGRTILTALGLAVGVALVITVSALSSGLSAAQASVLKPLTGVGTDMTVTRPLQLSTTGGGGNAFFSLTPKQRAQLRKENGGTRLGFRNIAKPGRHFSVDRFRVSTQLTFPASQVSKTAKLSGVADASGSLTLTDTSISGKIPKNISPPSNNNGSGFGFGSGNGSGQGSGSGRAFGPGTGGGRFFGGPSGISFNSRIVTGIDPSHPSLSALTPGQVTKGSYFSSAGNPDQAILSTAYAQRQGLSLGSTVTLSGTKFSVIGLASAPLGGSPSDIYVKLATLQKLAGLEGQINTMQVRAANGGGVSSVQREITSSFKGAQVTTAAELAKSIGGSLADAKNLAGKLGVALEVIGLLAAVLIACLLTLASVAKRIREIGTLKAVGWSQLLVVRQISLEALLQGFLGGILGVILGLIASQVVNAMGLTLTATLPGATPQSGPFGLGRFLQPAASGAGSTLVKIAAPVDLNLIVLAVVLAALGGLVAGAVGGLRAARMRPAVALRAVE